MKKITFLMTALMIGAAVSTVKGQLDVGCTDIPNVPPGTNVYPNIQTQVQYTRQNFGATVTSADVDSFTMEILVNGTKRQAFYRNMGTSFGSTPETTQGVTPLDWGALGLSAGSHSLCVQTRLWKSGAIVDVNQTNDAFCTTVNYSGDSNPFKYDLTVSNARFNDPLFIQGSNIPKGTFILELAFDLGNASATTQIPAGLTFDVNVTLGGTPYGPYTGTVNGLSPGGSTMYTIDALANGIFLPTNPGSFDLCIELVATSDDTDHSNDKNCGTYNLVLGVEDHEEVSNVDAFFFNNMLHVNMIEGANGIYTVNVVSTTGKAVLVQNLNSEDNREFAIPMNDLSTGMYITTVTSESGESMSFKFIK